MAYSQTLAASGGQPPYNWSVTTGASPGGLTLSSTGVLSGTPTNSGDFSFMVEVADSANVKASKAFSVTINPPLRIGQASTVGNQIRFQFTAQAGQSYAVELNASLSSTNWQTLTNIAAQPSAAVITVTDGISSGERYYRVRTP
jgi:large repetitive protein